MENLKTIRADSVYKGTFTESASYFGWKVDTSLPPPTQNKGFVLVKKNR